MSPMSPDSDKRKISKSKLLEMFDGWEISRSTDEQEIDFLCLRDDDYVRNRLEFIPKHCLIFADYSPEPAIYTQVVTKYCDKLPRDCGISLFTCNGVFVDDFLLESDKNLGLAFFLPRFPPSKLTFSIQTINSEDIRECDPSMLAEELVKETVTDDDNHNCLLFFKSEDIERRTKNFKDFEDSILTGLRKRFKPGKFSLLGCSFAEIYTKDSQNSKMCPDLHGEDEPKWIFLRVSGKSLQSWSLALENRLSTQDKKNKLLKFKENVIIKSNSFALVVNPMTSVSDVDEYFGELFTDLVVFEIQSASAASGQYCIDSTVSEEDDNFLVATENSTMLMVVTQF